MALAAESSRSRACAERPVRLSTVVTARWASVSVSESSPAWAASNARSAVVHASGVVVELDHEVGRGDVSVGEQRAGGGTLVAVRVVAGGGTGGDQRREAGCHAIVAGVLEVGADPGDGGPPCCERRMAGRVLRHRPALRPSEQFAASHQVLTVLPPRLTVYPRPADARVAFFGLDGVSPGRESSGVVRPNACCGMASIWLNRRSRVMSVSAWRGDWACVHSSNQPGTGTARPGHPVLHQPD